MEQPVAKNECLTNGATVGLVSLSSGGHRGVVDRVLQDALAQNGIDLVVGGRERVADLFPMLDDDIALFFRTAVVNAFQGRQTVGLFFRPGECFLTGRMKHRIKHGVFRVLKHVPRTQLLTIMPFSVDPRFAQVAHGWIDDVQFWDLDLLGDESGAEGMAIAQGIRARAQGRQVVVAVGTQNRLKGFDLFSRMLEGEPRLAARFLFVSGGRVAEDCRGAARAFNDAGGYLIDRFISEAELLGLYHAADIVWSCYAPDYNQASGIFGRAVQLGKPTLLRRGSYLEPLAVELGHAHLALPVTEVPACCDALLGWKPAPSDPAVRAQKIGARRARAMKVLVHALVGGTVAA